MKFISSLLFFVFTLISLTSFDTKIVIKGTVLDESRAALIGVSIEVKSNDEIYSSAIDGTFEVEIDQFPATLEFSHIGYEPQVYVINNTYNLEIIMEESPMLLDEVIVTGLSAKRFKKAMGYATSTITAAQIGNRPIQSQRKSQNNIRTSSGDIYQNSTSNHDYYGPVSENHSESYLNFVENQFIHPLDEALSTFSVDVDRASYSNIRRYIKGGQLPPVDAIRIEEMINYFEYDYSQPKGSDPITIQSTLTDCPWNEDHQLLHIGLQTRRIKTDDLPASNFVFLIDVSGSMHDRNKLPLIKSSMKLLIDQLRPNDRVAIVTYAGADQVVLESTAASDKYTILEAIDNLSSGGSTAGARGIKTAYSIAKTNFMKEGNNRIILATDGDFNVGISSNEALKVMIEKERKSGVYLSILGYGMGNYQEDLMQTLAQAGNGNHTYIDDLQEAQKTLIHEFGGTLFTVAKDVKIQVEFNPSKVSAYRLVGYETRMLAKEDFNNDRKDAGDMGSGHTVTAIYEIIPVGSDSKYFGNVDELKYQQKQKEVVLNNSNDIATIKFRYKQPAGDTSKKIEVTIVKYTESKDVTEDVNWAIATASFGMKLRGSDYLDDLEYDKIIDLAKQSRGIDTEGYRAEMIRLMKSAKGLASEYIADSGNDE